MSMGRWGDGAVQRVDLLEEEFDMDISSEMDLA